MFYLKFKSVVKTQKFLATEEDCFKALAREAKSTRQDVREFVPFAPCIEATGDLFNEIFVDDLAEAITEQVSSLNWRDQLRVDCMVSKETESGVVSTKMSFQILCEHKGKGKIRTGWDNTVISVKALI